jgi:hypothetical protein
MGGYSVFKIMLLITDQRYKENLEKIADTTPYENSAILFKEFFQNNNTKVYYPFFMRYPLGSFNFFPAVDPVFQKQLKQNLIKPLIIMVMDSYDLFSYNSVLKNSSYRLIIDRFAKNGIAEENVRFIINNKNIDNEIKETGIDHIKAKFYHFDYFLQLLSDKCHQFQRETHFEKHFVSLAQGKPRHHRFGMTFGLYKNDLIRCGRVSCCEWMNFHYQTQGYTVPHAPFGMTSEDYCKKFAFNQKPNDLVMFINNLPMVIDDRINLYTNPTDEHDIFKGAFINLVNETHFPNKQLFITEKTVRSILHCKPFIINGDPGSISYLRELGFKTFDRFWDEDYDNIDNDWDRIQSILEIIKKITALDLQQCYKMYQEMLPILEHNFNTLKKINQYENLKELF